MLQATTANAHIFIGVARPDIEQECRFFADVHGKTPHSARHAMGRHVMEKTGNVAAVQRQLGHKNAAYSLQYARITDEELLAVMDDR